MTVNERPEIPITPRPDPDPSWRRWAACYGVDPSLFFADRGGETAAAKRVCATCPVRHRCLDYALNAGERFGVWGGKAERERRPIRRRMRG